PRGRAGAPPRLPPLLGHGHGALPDGPPPLPRRHRARGRRGGLAAARRMIRATTPCEEQLIGLLAAAGRGPARDGVFALWLVPRAPPVYIYRSMSPRRLERRPSLESLVTRVDQQRPGEITGDTIPTGFASVDRLLGGGLRRRDLIVLGGDIGAGKSAFALGVALRVAQQGTGVAFLSGEMDEERLMERALAIEGRV